MTNPSTKNSQATALKLDRLIHQPARLVIMSNLYVVDEADFVYLSRQTGLTPGNISSHTSRLEDAGYVSIKKTFAGKRPRTVYGLTKIGREAFDRYRQNVTSLLPETP